MTLPCDSAHLCDVIIDCSYKIDLQFNNYVHSHTHKPNSQWIQLQDISTLLKYLKPKCGTGRK